MIASSAIQPKIFEGRVNSVSESFDKFREIHAAKLTLSDGCGTSWEASGAPVFELPCPTVNHRVRVTIEFLP